MPEAFAILRNNEWTRSPITREELEALARRRPDIGRVSIQGGDVVFETSLAHSGTRASEVIVLLHGGRLHYNRDANEVLIAWMLDVARALNARVRDNQFFTYRTPTEKFVHPDDVDLQNRYRTRFGSMGDGSG